MKNVTWLFFFVVISISVVACVTPKQYAALQSDINNLNYRIDSTNSAITYIWYSLDNVDVKLQNLKEEQINRLNDYMLQTDSLVATQEDLFDIRKRLSTVETHLKTAGQGFAPAKDQEVVKKKRTPY
ncbi:MAG TPA: hypothetical protein DCM08_12735 [Microscillaceae bacterium]|jgi:predicted  nucleic acid-binding Zn-ribbon protein|nr:hypothetical protein [Microscillaceae bacterium]